MEIFWDWSSSLIRLMVLLFSMLSCKSKYEVSSPSMLNVIAPGEEAKLLKTETVKGMGLSAAKGF